MSPGRHAGYGRGLTAVACAVLLVAGLALVGFSLHDQRSTPSVPLTPSSLAQREIQAERGTALGPASSVPAKSSPDSASTTQPSSAGVEAAPTKAGTSRTRQVAKQIAKTVAKQIAKPLSKQITKTVAKPVALSIPVIGVQSVLNPLGLDDQGALEVPARGPHYGEAAWFTGSPRPGQTGPAVLLGHVDGPGAGPSIFFRLAALTRGDRAIVSRADGTSVGFVVYRVERYPKNDFPTSAVYGDTAGPELRLITCGGSWNPAVGHYRDNTVVYARLVPPG